jgi:hypothetical protein
MLMKDALLSLGFNKVKAQIYTKLITIVFEALLLAERRMKNDDNWKKFLAKKGALLNYKKINGVTVIPLAEEGITAELHAYLDEIKLEGALSDSLRTFEVEFRLNEPMKSTTRTGKYSNKPDLTAKTMKRDFQAATISFEAKNIHMDRDINSHYLGDQGIHCFIREKESYTDNDLGVMLAYTLYDEEKIWIEKISKNISSKYPSLNQHIKLPFKEDAVLTTDIPKDHLPSERVKLFHLVMKFDPHVRT